MVATNVAVIGIGRIGLPLGLYIARNGFFVYGIDRNPSLIQQVQNGQLPFRINYPMRVIHSLLKQRFHPTTDYAIVHEASYIIITVGANDEYTTDLESVLAVIRVILPHLQKSQTLIVRSTVPPKSTRQIKEFIEENSEWQVGKTIFLAYCPDRSLEGKTLDEIDAIPQIVGADDPVSLKKATSFFRRLTKAVLPTNTVSAELAKLFSNVYRYVDFALANEFMMMAEGLGQNIYEIRRLVNEGYERGGLKRPGLTAGPCLPKSTQLLPSSPLNPGLAKIAYEINESVPEFLVKRIRELRKGELKGVKVAILGKAFKGNVDDERNSLVPKLVTLLKKEESTIAIHDPYLLPDVQLRDVLRGSTIVIVGANHDAYKGLSTAKLRRLTNRPVLICDIWNVLGAGKTLNFV